MTSASSLAFPGSRTLATWWRQLAPVAPQQLWVGYLFLHRLEALALCLETQPLDPLLHLALEALALETTACQGPAPSHDELCRRLQERLPLDQGVIRRLVRTLAQMQLLQGAEGQPWALTELGKQALLTRQLTCRRPCRKVFAFVEQLDPLGSRIAPPHYLAIHDVPGHPWQVEEDCAFDTSWLLSSVRQPDDWKTSFGFPAEIRDLSVPSPAALTWDKVIFDRTERLLVVFALTEASPPASSGKLLGFAVRPEGWVLQSAAPIVRLPAAARAFSRELAHDPSTEIWKQAWLAWCQARLLPAAEADSCRLSYLGARLRVEAPEPLFQRVQTGKSDMLRDVLKGEAWLLAGEGYLRAAARMEAVRMA